MNDNLFKNGKRYYTTTRKGEMRIFETVMVYKRKSTGERVVVEGSFDGKAVQRFEIKRASNGSEYIIVDERYCTVISADYEYNR